MDSGNLSSVTVNIILILITFLLTLPLGILIGYCVRELWARKKRVDGMKRAGGRVDGMKRAGGRVDGMKRAGGRVDGMKRAGGRVDDQQMMVVNTTYIQSARAAATQEEVIYEEPGPAQVEMIPLQENDSYGHVRIQGIRRS